MKSFRQDSAINSKGNEGETRDGSKKDWDTRSEETDQKRS